jgi:hypothetical protein
MDYKKYSLENLENWLHDAMSAGEATPQEIYDVIVEVVKDNYYTYKQKTSEAYELLTLLNGSGKGNIKEFDDCVDKILSCDRDDPSPECKGAWNDFGRIAIVLVNIICVKRSITTNGQRLMLKLGRIGNQCL